jgi:Bacterial pre-peptidase C-terminal domain
MTRIVRGLMVTTGLLALLGLGSPALASVIIEAEANGTAVNNTLGTAQAIPSSAFTTPVPATVFDPPGFPTATITGAGGGADVDFYSFTATGGSLLLDIDDPTTFDTILSLFSSDGTLLAEDDDSGPADPGSSSELHSFVGTFTLPGPGTYFVAVSEFANFPNGLDSCSGSAALTRPDGEFGGISFTGCSPDSTFPISGVQQGFGYTLHISLSAPAAVPMPATLALLISAGAGLGAVRAWRRW